MSNTESIEEINPLFPLIQTAKIPFSDASISEMFILIDWNADGELGWGEWHDFISKQVGEQERGTADIESK